MSLANYNGANLGLVYGFAIVFNSYPMLFPGEKFFPPRPIPFLSTNIPIVG